MNNNVRIAKDLLRIAKMLVAFSRNELEAQLKKIGNPDLNIQENLECLEKMSPKEQKAALFWIRRKSLILPEDLGKFEQAMNLINKQRLDFQKFERPMDVINRDDKSTQRIKSQDASFNPDSEPTFKNRKSLKNGVVVYYVDESREGQKAVRKAIDVNWGYDKNPWCLAARKNGFDQYEIERLTEEQKEKLGLYGDELETAWRYWNHYNAYPKRIAFQNGNLLAFCASEGAGIEWWDKNDRSSEEIPGLDLEDDDMDFLVKYAKRTIARKTTSEEILEEFSNDQNPDIREKVAKNPNTPVRILKKLMKDNNQKVRMSVAQNINTPAEMLVELAKVRNEDDIDVMSCAVHNNNFPVEELEKMADDERFYIRNRVASNLNATPEILEKLANDENESVRLNVADNPKAPVKVLEKLANDKNDWVRAMVARNPNASVEILDKLAEDLYDMVREGVARNKKTSSIALGKMINDKSDRVRSLIAEHENATPDMLVKLADDAYKHTRWNVAFNNHTSIETLEKLLKDKEENVRQVAERELKKRKKNN